MARTYSQNNWTKEEIALLIKLYEDRGSDIDELLVRHSKAAIRKKAIKLKLSDTSPHRMDLSSGWYPNKCGVFVRIKEHRADKSIIEFKDGFIKEASPNICRKRLCTTAHPVLSVKNQNYNGFTVKAQIKVDNFYDAYYEAECQKCNMKGIFTPQQMIEHAKQHEIGCK